MPENLKQNNLGTVLEVLPFAEKAREISLNFFRKYYMFLFILLIIPLLNIIYFFNQLDI
jgi:hypothetical protein